MKEFLILAEVAKYICPLGVRWVGSEGTHRFDRARLVPAESGVSHVPHQPPQSKTLTRQFATLLLACAWLTATATVYAGDTWQSELARMPLGAHVTELDRTNCVSVMLNAFRSNAVVKSLIFMPGATDELFFYRRAHAQLTNADPSLLDAVVALTNQTFIRATFQPPLLLLHTSEDSLSNIATIKDRSTAAKLRHKTIPERLVFDDAGWDEVRAAVSKNMSVSLRPFSNAPLSWHFFRHNFAACGVTEWEMLKTIALADKTRFTVHWLTVDFQLNLRTGATPDAKDIHFP